eukprot:TRINITY_DN40102_c0_g1_i1.p1 TRINITY_DN40102_c0_g1~~TRINITY_DN40102_c0_g1_i1.p1  ORF type:complete len:312 (+),score=88.42 TRINITY_DN40102_c0_g1_i1:103-1038(+)
MYNPGSFRNPYSVYYTGQSGGRQSTQKKIPVTQESKSKDEQQKEQQSSQQQQQKKQQKDVKSESGKQTVQTTAPEEKPEKKSSETKTKEATQQTALSSVPSDADSRYGKIISPFAEDKEEEKEKEKEQEKEKEKPSTVLVKTGQETSKDSSTNKSIQKGLREDMSNLAKKLSEMYGGPGQGKNDLSGLKVVTLAGENRGAVMDVGSQPRRGSSVFEHDKSSVGLESKDSSEDAKKANKEGLPASASGGPVNAYVNSNVQSANNSILYSSTCPHRDPGVKLALSNNPVTSKEVAASQKDASKKDAKRRMLSP